MTSSPPTPSIPANQNPTALITGASGGLGEEYARQLAAKGHHLILVARREEKLRAIRDDLVAQHSIDVEIRVADLANPQDVLRLAGQIADGAPLDLLINNAGFGTLGNFADVDPKRQLEMVEVHTAAPMRLIRAALPGMIQRRRGAIINVSSVAGFIVAAGSATYCATKAFLNTFSESLQIELASTGVRVQALCPGFTHTGFHSTDEFAHFDRAQIPAFLWMSAEDVVATSLRRLNSGHVICVPGFKNRCLVGLLRCRFIRHLAGRMARKREQ